MSYIYSEISGMQKNKKIQPIWEQSVRWNWSRNYIVMELLEFFLATCHVFNKQEKFEHVK